MAWLRRKGMCLPAFSRMSWSLARASPSTTGNRNEARVFSDPDRWPVLKDLDGGFVCLFGAEPSLVFGSVGTGGRQREHASEPANVTDSEAREEHPCLRDGE